MIKNIVRLLIVVVLISEHGFAQTPSQRTILEIVGTQRVSVSELLTQMQQCLATNPKWEQEHNPTTLNYCKKKLEWFLCTKGHLQSTVSEKVSAARSDGYQITLNVTEGPLFRFGQYEIRGVKLFSPEQVHEMVKFQRGTVANSKLIETALFVTLQSAYENHGYIRYSAEVDPNFHVASSGREGNVDLTITIDEGQAYKVRSITFPGVDKTTQTDLVARMFVKSGDIFNAEAFQMGLRQLTANSVDYEQIDPDQDVDLRCNDEMASVDVVVHLKKKRQRQ